MTRDCVGPDSRGQPEPYGKLNMVEIHRSRTMGCTVICYWNYEKSQHFPNVVLSVFVNLDSAAFFYDAFGNAVSLPGLDARRRITKMITSS